MTDTRKLLADYAENGSEPAFRELVSRYINLVYSTALRLAGGNRPLAEDVTQTVFINLSEKAGTISRDAMLGGWLHQHTFHVATKAVRAEQRRQNRESEAALMNALHESTGAGLRDAAPILDEAITQLGDEDRTAILLRYFEQRDFRAVGAALGSNEDAARMRVNRALEKLQVILKGRGVALSAAALGTALATDAVIAAPAGLAATVAGTVLAGSAAAGGATATIIKIMTITKLKLAAGGLMAGLAAVVAVQTHTNANLRDQNAELQKKLTSMSELRSENERLAGVPVNTNAAALTQDQFHELLRLRSELGSLKRQVAEATRSKLQARGAAPVMPPPVDPASEEKQMAEFKEQAITKMNHSRQWMLAFIMYANDHQGQSPASYDQAARYLDVEVKDDDLAATNHFDIVYQGKLQELTNASSTIVLRETQGVQLPDGSWVRAYAFADGHAEIHKAADGNFADWENGKIQMPVGR
jgi:RNA polymerase sigma factor (sigma-70 family)